MSIIDEKGRLLGKVNIIDLLLVLLVLGVIAGSLYKFDLFNRFQPQQQEVTATVAIYEVLDYTVEALQEGDLVLESVENAPIGRIVKKEVAKARKEVPNADGELVEAVSPNRYDIVLTLEGPLEVKGEDIYVGKKVIKIGSKLFVRAPKAVAEGYIIKLGVK